ncbi:FAD-dependent oxidoreductase [Methylobacterium radiodurans]|uniref:2-polyprenyl-6-methoxyphenol hydroxylase n=1 Tax=Methylobacterium radiodurans TaxID=2202828 RepID=A0A2U8VVY8_9HYPH|nr:FAD-dependent monooxygenase [Methylobacterium radiodurans]AWN37999.1 2-polyprenyl-6-methoxyphenol hydroxylase [Methylobacterium radiodurans]
MPDGTVDGARAEIAIVGGGLAGSLAAAMLGRAGRDVVLIDPHAVYPPDFRCEKLEQGHIEVLRRTGLAEPVIRAATRADTLWIARFGRVVDKVPFRQYGLAYDSLVNAVREEIPPTVRILRTVADAVEPDPVRPRVHLPGGGAVAARLVVLASGLNWRLREDLGIHRDLVSACHSVTVGFDIERADGLPFAFPGLQYNPERYDQGLAYLTLFRIGASVRANLFLYQPLRSPWLARFRADPDAALRELMPRLERLIGPYRVAGPVKVRPTDLHVAHGIEKPGVVLVGDAFATPCPATGTGSLKVFTDVERLCNHHVPAWLAGPETGTDKVAAFYADPVKRACDTLSAAKAFELRALSTGSGLSWSLRRWLRFFLRLARWNLRRMLRSPRTRLDRAGVRGADAV